MVIFKINAYALYLSICTRSFFSSCDSPSTYVKIVNIGNSVGTQTDRPTDRQIDLESVFHTLDIKVKINIKQSFVQKKKYYMNFISDIKS